LASLPERFISYQHIPLLDLTYHDACSATVNPDFRVDAFLHCDSWKMRIILNPSIVLTGKSNRAQRDNAFMHLSPQDNFNIIYSTTYKIYFVASMQLCIALLLMSAYPYLH